MKAKHRRQRAHISATNPIRRQLGTNSQCGSAYIYNMYIYVYECTLYMQCDVPLECNTTRHDSESQRWITLHYISTLESHDRDDGILSLDDFKLWRDDWLTDNDDDQAMRNHFARLPAHIYANQNECKTKYYCCHRLTKLTQTMFTFCGTDFAVRAALEPESWGLFAQIFINT